MSVLSSSVGKGISGRAAFCQSLVVIAFLAPALAGCATGNLLSKAETDSSILTSSVPDAAADPAQGPLRENASDEMTIRNAVSSANLEELDGKAIAWANQDTGSRGAIVSVYEYRDKGVLCRKFKANVESFEGVSLVSGEACLKEAGLWWTRSFVRG